MPATAPAAAAAPRMAAGCRPLRTGLTGVCDSEAAAVAAVIVLWCLRRRLGRGPLVAALFFGGTLFPALGFFDVYPMQYSFVADHFQYLASLGVLTLLAAGAAQGLGGATAQALREKGAEVALLDLPSDRLDAHAGEIGRGDEVTRIAVGVGERMNIAPEV